MYIFLVSLMLRILSLIVLLIFSGISGVFAADAPCNNTSTLTQADFKLDLGCMDPLGASHTAQS